MAVAGRQPADWPSSARSGTTAAIRFGVFKSARPNDMVAAGHRPHIPEHPAVPEHDRARERARRDAHQAAQQPASTRLISTRAAHARKRRHAAAGTRAAGLVGLRGRDDVTARNLPYGDQRRLEIARALASEPGAAAARRADGGHEPQRDRGDDGADRPAAARPGADHPAHRARHARRDGRSATGSRCSTTASASPRARRTRSAPTPR